MELLKDIVDQSDEQCSSDDALAAVSMGHFEILEWMLQQVLRMAVEGEYEEIVDSWPLPLHKPTE